MTVRLSIMTMNDMNPSNDSDTAPAQSLSAQPLPPRPAPQSAAQSQTPMPQTPQYVQPGPSMQPQYAGQPEAWAQPLPPQDVSQGVPRIVSQGVSQPVPQAAIPAVQPAQYAAQLVYPTYPVQPTYPAQPMYPTQPTYPAQSAYFPIPGATVGSTAPRSSVLRSTSGLRATTLFRCAATIRANGSGNASHNAQRNACHDARSNARGHADRSSPCMAHVASQGGQSCNGTDSRL